MVFEFEENINGQLGPFHFHLQKNTCKSIEFRVVRGPKTKGLGTGIMGPPHSAEARGMYRQSESRQG